MEKKIIILHGWASKIKRWHKIQRELEKKNWQVFLPSLPGFGQTEILKPWSLDDYVNWLKDFCQQKKLKEFVLLGHSFGGSIALKFASRNFKGLKKLILINSAGVRGGLSLKKLLFLMMAKTGKAFFLFPPFCFFKKSARWLLYTLAREKDYYQAKKIMRQTMKKILKEDLRRILGKIKVPTLIMWGAKDRQTPLYQAYLIKKGIANSQLVVYDNIGHDLPFKKTKELVKKITHDCF